MQDQYTRRNYVCQEQGGIVDIGRALQAIVRFLEENGDVHQKDVAAALGVAPPQVGRWKKALEEGRVVHPNMDTRDAITSLMSDQGEARLAGMREMVEFFEKASMEARRGLMVREMLRTYLEGLGATPQLSARDAQDLSDLEDEESRQDDGAHRGAEGGSR